MIVSYLDVQTTPLIEGDRFIVLACDGIFEVMSRQQVVDFINQNLDEYSDKQKIDVQGVIAICQALCNRCVAKEYGENWEGHGNLTVVVFVLERFRLARLVHKVKRSKRRLECNNSDAKRPRHSFNE